MASRIFMASLPPQHLYDSAKIAIPTDNVDEEYLREPQRWDVRLSAIS
jgi:hypothetical protein